MANIAYDYTVSKVSKGGLKNCQTNIYKGEEKHDTRTASLDLVLVHKESLSCFGRTLATTPQISSASSNCSPTKAINCQTQEIKLLSQKTEE